MVTQFKYLISRKSSVISGAIAMAIVTGFSNSAIARIQFSPPNDPAPTDTTGGGVRGIVQFQAPGDSAPTNTTGGGVRGIVQFQAPGDAAPTNTIGGGVRGDVGFQAPGDAAPTNTIGGGVRGDVGFQAPGDAAPTNTIGGGVRSDELAQVIPLLPATKYGRTVAARPTILVYVPPTSVKQQVFFSLQDEQRNHHYQTMLELSGDGGIVSVALPEDAPELELGKTYVWFFAPLQTGGVLQPDNYGVVGWVKRVEPSVEIDRAADPIETAIELAESGIWYDTLSLVAAATQNQPDNSTYASEWHDLLEQVGLNALAGQQIDRL